MTIILFVQNLTNNSNLCDNVPRQPSAKKYRNEQDKLKIDEVDILKQ